MDKKKILVADDSPTVVEILKFMLEERGYEVQIASDGLAAIEQAYEVYPDLILLDIDMPRMNGYQACHLLKNDDVTRNIPIIILTSRDQKRDYFWGMAVGADDYLNKDLESDDLFRRIAELIETQAKRERPDSGDRAIGAQDILSRLNELLDRKLFQATLVNELSSLATTVQSLDGTAESILGLLNRACEFDLAALFLKQDPGGYLIMHIASTHGSGLVREMEKQVLDTVLPDGAGAEAVRRYFVGDELEETLSEGTLGTFFSVPLEVRNVQIGTLFIGALAEKIVTDEVQETLKLLVKHCAIVLDNVLLFRSLEGVLSDLQQANNELEHRVEERTAELAKLNVVYERFVPREFLSFLEKESIVDVQLADQVEREMTVMFSDIRDFTPLSEQMTPQENFNFLNSYFSRMSPIIRQHHGFIDKYIGDGIMALFLKEPDDAVRAAIAMRTEVTLYNSHRQNCDYEPIRIGIGLHTGNLMLGIIGEKERMQGTVIADAVNLASRLESLTKRYRASIVISGQVLDRLQNLGEYTYRFLDKVRVKGKKEPVSIFEILDGEPEAVLAMRERTRADFEAGIVLYYERKFAEASEKFNNALRQNPEDGVIQLYLQRAAHFMVQGVPPDWCGVEELKDG